MKSRHQMSDVPGMLSMGTPCNTERRLANSAGSSFSRRSERNRWLVSQSGIMVSSLDLYALVSSFMAYRAAFAKLRLQIALHSDSINRPAAPNSRDAVAGVSGRQRPTADLDQEPFRRLLLTPAPAGQVWSKPMSPAAGTPAPLTRRPPESG